MPAHAQRMSSLLALDRGVSCRVARRAYGARCGQAERRVTAMHAACRAGLDCRFGAGHGEERTWNMPRMSVTLEVSKLSGWLNADAYCRESNGGHTERGEGAGQQTGATASSVQ